MNTLSFMLAIAMVIASTTIVITQMDFTLSRSAEYTEFENSLNSLKSLDTKIRDLSVEAENSQRLVRFAAGGGILRTYDDTDMIEYYVGRGFGSVQRFAENGITFIYESGSTTLRVNYTGSLDIKGNISRSGTFYVSLKKNPGNIEIEVP